MSVIYSTGCSFNISQGLISFIGLFQTEEEALAAEKLIEAHHTIYEASESPRWGAKSVKPPKSFKPYNFNIVNNGTKQLVSTTWHGYFEDLTCVNIEKFKLLDLKKDKEYENNFEIS